MVTILFGMTANLAASLRLIAVTDDRLVVGRDVLELCRAAEAGGATCLQIRLKNCAPRALAELVRSVLSAVRLPVLVNDRVDVALAAGAHGVHLGADDLPPDRVRQIVPPGFVVGASVGDLAEAGRGAGADYWGIGPWRTSPTKGDAGAALGPTGFRSLAARSAGRPCVAIGGIGPEDVPAVLASGGCGVAVASAVFGAGDVQAATARLARAFGGTP